MDKWKKSSTTSERLKEAMHISNLKQADLARMTGLSKGGISNYVTGRYEPKSDIIGKLASALNCSEMWLWGYDVPMERNRVSHDNPQLTDGAKQMLDLFNQVPEDKQSIVIEMIRAALKTK